MRSSVAWCSVRLSTVMLVLAAAMAAQPVTAQDGCDLTDTCRAPRRAGEVSLVFLGDSGYGEGGASEWGSHAQGDVAARIEELCPRPDMVFFLGDNIYWKGSPDLFGPRFDTVYRSLFDKEGRRVHSALGNHDVKGCQVPPVAGFGAGESCLNALQRAVQEDLRREAAAAGEATDGASPWISREVRERATKVSAANCPPPTDGAYEQQEVAGAHECFATAALRHPSFGYQVYAGNPMRYYTVDWPAPPQADTATPSEDPRVRVLVADSNTLDVHGHRLVNAEAEGHGTKDPGARRDELQMLWMENQLRMVPDGTWRIVSMHHPPYTPRGCAFKVLGRCVGGHGDEKDLQVQFRSVFGSGKDLHRPDILMTAHNHFYARTRSLDPAGYPLRAEIPGIRYFVTGGGGAPLYRLQPRHARYASAGSYYHFVYMRLQKEFAFFWAIDERGKVRDAGCFKQGDSSDGTVDHDFEKDVLVCKPDVTGLRLGAPQ